MTKSLEQKSESNSNISKTGYRILLLFKLLFESPRSRMEIDKEFEKDDVLKKGISYDTITNIVKALRKSGCIVKRPNIGTGYKYILEKHPFTTEISEKALEGLQKIRDGITSFSDWQLLCKINRLYEKFANFTMNEKHADLLLYNHPLKNVDINLLEELVKHCESKQLLKITYTSPIFGTERLTFIPDFISFENNVTYLWGYNLRYQAIGYLRLDRIKSLKKTFCVNTNSILEQYESCILTVTYKLTGFAKLAYEPTRFEHIIIENPDYIVVEAKVFNKFNFLQRLLSFGLDCKILTPRSYIEEYLLALQNIRETYTNEKQKNS